MKQFSKFAMVLAKVLEILFWITDGLMAVLFVCSLAARDWICGLLTAAAGDGVLMGARGGFEMVVPLTGGTVNGAAVTLLAVEGIISAGLMAMVFRNVYLIFRTAQGKTWFSKGNTPFQQDITRMVREIGIFTIAVPFCDLAVCVLARLILGADAVELSVDLQGFVVGFLVLCLSQVFSYGQQLQGDVDGLL